jgi:hypothetical protein
MNIHSLRSKTLKNEKTRFAFQPNGFSRCGGKSLHELLEGLAGDEFHGLRSLDFDFLAGLGIYSGAGFAGSNFESSKSDKLNTLGLLDAGFDAVNHGIHGALSIGFAASECFLDRGDEFDFVHLMKGEMGALTEAGKSMP